MSRAVELGSEDLEGVWVPLALLHLRSGKTADYRRLVSTALDRFGATVDLGVASHLGILAKLDTVSSQDLAAALTLLEQALVHKPDAAFARCVRAQLLIRAGRAAEAVTILEGMVPAVPNQSDQRFNLLFLALGRQQLGRRTEALAALSAAEQWPNRVFNAWYNQIDFNRTRDELELLLQR